ncbi:DMT family transporter [Streptomyces sp. NPDC007088]|uniref:DMT family transporter n=1 Tax=Streptomyces sp. NPDC007088 TaxID=3364773 RepID=UPI0036A92DCC
MPLHTTAPVRGALLAASACVLVGGSFSANSLLADYPYADGQALRYGLAALLLLPFLPRGLPRVPRELGPRQWGRLAVLAAVGMVGFNLAVLAAERSAEPAVPGVLVGCAPVVVAVLVPLLSRRRPHRALLAGALCVAAGAVVVQGWGRTDTAGLVFSVAALAGECGFALLAVPVLPVLGPLRLTATVCALAAVQSACLALAFGGGAALRAPNAVEAGALLWQAAVVTVVGFLCWYAGISRIGAERATLFSGLIPVSAAATAPLLGTGGYGTAQALGSLLVAVGVAVGARTPAPAAAPRVSPVPSAASG